MAHPLSDDELHLPKAVSDYFYIILIYSKISLHSKLYSMSFNYKITFIIDIKMKARKTDLAAIFSAPETYSIHALNSEVEWKLAVGVGPQSWSMITNPAIAASSVQKTGALKYPPHIVYWLHSPL